MRDMIETILHLLGLKDYFIDKREKERLKDLKSCLLRYFEKGQHGGYVDFIFTRSLHELQKDGLFGAQKITAAQQALIELVEDGFLEYHDGHYFLKGRTPKYR